jgi:hypothetical protein
MKSTTPTTTGPQSAISELCFGRGHEKISQLVVLEKHLREREWSGDVVYRGSTEEAMAGGSGGRESAKVVCLCVWESERGNTETALAWLARFDVTRMDALYRVGCNVKAVAGGRWPVG